MHNKDNDTINSLKGQKPMKTGVFFILIFIMILGCDPSKEEKPNIILIMADDLGMEAIGTYGGESYETPHLDQLAAEGMRFENCYSTPLCTPSRVQIMTGKYNFRNYIGFGLLDKKEKTFGHALQEAGYKTAIAGKWQLYGNEKQQELAGGKVGTLPLQAGFDTYRLWQVKDRGERYKSPTLETYQEGLVDYDEAYGPDKFVEFIESFMTKNRDEPFFVYFPMCLVHAPFEPTPESPEFETYDPKERINDTTYFKDMVFYMDEMVGKIVDKVDELGVREETIILFIGDNGTDQRIVSQWQGRAIQGGKGTTLDAGTHVPFIANWKGKISPGSINNSLVDFTDFYPSLLEMAGVDIKEFTDGTSFYPQLLGDNTNARKWVFGHYDPRWLKNRPFSRYVHNTEYKLYHDGKFFNFKRDPNELNPIEEEDLTVAQLQVKEDFQEVLDKMNNN